MTDIQKKSWKDSWEITQEMVEKSAYGEDIMDTLLRVLNGGVSYEPKVLAESIKRNWKDYQLEKEHFNKPQEFCGFDREGNMILG
jgi:hypothetical protein